MKSKRLLFGLIVAAFVGGFNVASAQTKANYQNSLIEIGPDNLGGRVRSIVVDQSDPTHTTLYAGGVAGGLFKKYGNQPWQYITYNKNNHEITLPISAMIQLPDNNILIATGEGIVSDHGVLDARMSPKGRGLYLYNIANKTFTLFTATDPNTHPEWTYINKLDLLERDGNIYLYAATSEGLYRWKFTSGNINTAAAPSLVVAGNFLDIDILSADNVAYATCPGKVYRVGNVTGQSNAVDVTNSNPSFATSTRIEMTALTAHSNGEHTTYLYAMVADANGMLDAVYLTHNQQTWTRLTTSSISPFTTANPGYLNAAIAIDPTNYKHIIIGGATVWDGNGYVENSYYQWTKASYSERELNYGNYMSVVYGNPMVVHSGINQIIANPEINDGDTNWVYYFATNGGIYKAQAALDTFVNCNKGFNTVQYNSIAVAPDGSIVGGAMDNSCPFIQSRNAHSGGEATNQWYDDDPESNMNHVANVLWNGNGAGVEASIFQQVLPISHRGLFFSCEPGYFDYITSLGDLAPVASFGRSFGDYFDYTNTQTWSSGSDFLSNMVPDSRPVPRMKLWETTNNTSFNDSITFTLDTLGVYYHNGVETPLRGNTQIQAGDKVLVPSPAHFNYPFEYTFTQSFRPDQIDTIQNGDTYTYKTYMSHKVHNPLANRIIVTGISRNNEGIVAINTSPTDFRKVWDVNESASQDPAVINRQMNWSVLYRTSDEQVTGAIAWSHDADAVFVNVINKATGESYIVRVYDITKADINSPLRCKNQLEFVKTPYEGMLCVTHYDTIYAQNGGLFKRPITAIEADPRPGKDNLVITFGGYDTLGEPNMVYIENATDPITRRIINMHVVNENSNMTLGDPVYSAMVEYTTGKIYAGTEKGVFTNVVNDAGINADEWFNFGSFDGVPVTSIRQQTREMERIRFDVHEGVNTETYLFAKTKYPYAIYFGTYGRGVFMDTTFVTDHVNEVVNEEDYIGITNVDKGNNRIAIYPNPAVSHATVDISVAQAGNATLKVYDVNGRLVINQNYGYLAEGLHQKTIDCSMLKHGMYLVNINCGGQAATSKLIVR